MVILMRVLIKLKFNKLKNKLMKFSVFSILLFFTASIYSQTISKDDLIGAWVIEDISINPRMFTEADIDKESDIKSIFLSSKIFFTKDQLIKMEMNGQLPEPFNYKMFDKVLYYSIKNDLINVGHYKYSSSIMSIDAFIENDNLILNFLNVTLKAKPINQKFKLKFEKISLFEISPSKPLLNEEITELNIIDFKDLDLPPTAFDCDEFSDSENLKKCISTNITKHVNMKFNVDIVSALGISGTVKIESEFVINKEGDIVNIISNSTNEKLSEEATRVINMLPRFKPALLNSVPVNVNYKLPITFKIVD